MKSKNRGVVLLEQQGNVEWVPDLWLSNVRRNKDGLIKSGWVVNGAWRYEVSNGMEKAKNYNNKVVNKWPLRNLKEILVLEDWVEVKQDGYDCYNEVMRRASAIANDDKSFEFKFKSTDKINKIRAQLKELEDGIPF